MSCGPRPPQHQTGTSRILGTALSRGRCRIVLAALTSLVLLQGCTTTPPSHELLESSTRTCYATLIADHVDACLTINYGWRLRVAVQGASPRWSAPLPIHTPITMRQRLTVSYGFGAFWIGYDGHPFGIVRVDMDTLEPTANIRFDSNWLARRLGTGNFGTSAVGESAIYALSDKKLHRIDPHSAAVVTSVEYPLGGEVFADGNQLWLAQSTAVSRIDPETLAVLEAYVPPPEMKVGWNAFASLWPQPLPDFVRDSGGMKIVLSDYSAHGRLPVLRFGRPDRTTRTIVVIEGTPVPREIAPIPK